MYGGIRNMLRYLGSFLGRLGLRVVGAALIIIGTSLSAVSGGSLYMVATDRVRPGEPIFPDALAMSLGNSIVGLLVGIVLVIAGYELYKLALRVHHR